MKNKYLEKWILKANNDLSLALHEVERLDCVTDAICFHCQQTVEKFFKAYLIFKDEDFSKTHNLEFLLIKCAKFDETFNSIDLKDLSFYAVEARYPDNFYIPSIEESKECIEIAQNVKEFVLARILC